MINGKKVVLVIPAYNASKTLRDMFEEIPHDVLDQVVVVDDASQDDTVDIATSLGALTFVHEANLGYGRNQKTCYNEALKLDADIVIMLHGDYQYTPRLITAMASLIAYEQFSVVLGSRILGVGALAGGMPRYIRVQPVSNFVPEPVSKPQVVRVSYRLSGLFSSSSDHTTLDGKFGRFRL